MSNFEPRSIKNFLPDELFEKVKKAVLEKNMGPNGNLFYHTVVGRWVTEIWFDEETEKELLELARKEFGDNDIKRAGCSCCKISNTKWNNTSTMEAL